MTSLVIASPAPVVAVRKIEAAAQDGHAGPCAVAAVHGSDTGAQGAQCTHRRLRVPSRQNGHSDVDGARTSGVANQRAAEACTRPPDLAGGANREAHIQGNPA